MTPRESVEAVDEMEEVDEARSESGGCMLLVDISRGIQEERARDSA